MKQRTEEEQQIINDIRRSHTDYTIIVVDGDYHLTCNVCPTIYDFKGEDGLDYYFRYRHGYLTFGQDDKILIKKQLTDEDDGMINWPECCFVAFLEKYLIIDIDSEDEPWINHPIVNDIIEKHQKENNNNE